MSIVAEKRAERRRNPDSPAHFTAICEVDMIAIVSSTFNNTLGPLGSSSCSLDNNCCATVMMWPLLLNRVFPRRTLSWLPVALNEFAFFINIEQ